MSDPDRRRRWRGLSALAIDAVDNGARAVERVHLATARRTFDVLDMIPPIALPARGVRLLHDAMTSSVYAIIRVTTRAVGGTIDVLLDL